MNRAIAATSPGSSVQPGTRTKRTQTGWWRAASRRAKRERRGDAAAGHPPGDGRVERLDVEQDQVGGVQQLVVGAAAEVAGGVERGVQAELLRAGQDGPGERGLQQRLAAGDGQPAAGRADEPPVAVRPGRARSAALIRCPVRPDQVSGLWQYTHRSGQPAVNTTNRVPGPSTPVEMIPGVHRTGDLGRAAAGACGASAAGGGHGHTDSWKVRLTTSSCCSRVSRTKLTAYPETRIVSCG